jgi:hypothetical protein
VAVFLFMLSSILSAGYRQCWSSAVPINGNNLGTVGGWGGGSMSVIQGQSPHPNSSASFPLLTLRDIF